MCFRTYRDLLMQLLVAITRISVVKLLQELARQVLIGSCLCAVFALGHSPPPRKTAKGAATLHV